MVASSDLADTPYDVEYRIATHLKRPCVAYIKTKSPRVTVHVVRTVCIEDCEEQVAKWIEERIE